MAAASLSRIHARLPLNVAKISSFTRQLTHAAFSLGQPLSQKHTVSIYRYSTQVELAVVTAFRSASDYNSVEYLYVIRQSKDVKTGLVNFCRVPSRSAAIPQLIR